MSNYIAITPARDEEKFLPRLIESMAAQTIAPTRWIILDDGSTDATARLIDEAAKKYLWIDPHHLRHERAQECARREGGESIVMRFLPRSLWCGYDAILRLDADLSFNPDFVESLAAEFRRDPALGIAGATLHEPRGGGWREIPTPSFHTRGAVKMYSTECFDQIGGLDGGLGWDTIDEARAMMLGFKSRSFRHIVAYHHRPQGAASGSMQANFAAGRAAYNAGYHPLFLALRAARRGLSWPPVIGGVSIFAGYIRGYLRRDQMTASPELVKFVRRQQLRRLFLMDSVWR